MKPKLLDLFCGAGGAGMGYHLAGFDVVGVDADPQPNYPFPSIQADWRDYLKSEGKKYAVIHASPPCQAYTGMRNISIARFGSGPSHPDLVEDVRHLLQQQRVPYVIENVRASPVDTQIILCGASFGLIGLSRHRHFESSLLLPNPPRCMCRKNTISIGVYGAKPDGRRVSYRHHKLSRVANSLEEAARLMDINWMTWDEIREAIPPAYTKWIGDILLSYLATTP